MRKLAPASPFFWHTSTKHPGVGYLPFRQEFCPLADRSSISLIFFSRSSSSTSYASSTSSNSPRFCTYKKQGEGPPGLPNWSTNPSQNEKPAEVARHRPCGNSRFRTSD